MTDLRSAAQRVNKAWKDMQESIHRIPLADGVRGNLFAALADLRSALQQPVQDKPECECTDWDCPLMHGPSTSALAQPQEQRKYRVWDCKIAIPMNVPVPDGFDLPPRRAAMKAVLDGLGISEVAACFSGWGGTLTPTEITIADGPPMTMEGTNAQIDKLSKRVEELMGVVGTLVALRNEHLETCAQPPAVAQPEVLRLAADVDEYSQLCIIRNGLELLNTKRKIEAEQPTFRSMLAAVDAAIARNRAVAPSEGEGK